MAAIAGSTQQLPTAKDQHILHEKIAASPQFLQKFTDMVRRDALRFGGDSGKRLLRITKRQRSFLGPGRKKWFCGISHIKNTGQELIGPAGGREIHKLHSFIEAGSYSGESSRPIGRPM